MTAEPIHADRYYSRREFGPTRELSSDPAAVVRLRRPDCRARPFRVGALLPVLIAFAVVPGAADIIHESGAVHLIAGTPSHLVQDDELGWAYVSIDTGKAVTDWYPKIREQLFTNAERSVFLAENGQGSIAFLSPDTGRVYSRWIKDIRSIEALVIGYWDYAILKRNDGLARMLALQSGLMIGKWFQDVEIDKRLQTVSRVCVEVTNDRGQRALLSLNFHTLETDWVDEIDRQYRYKYQGQTVVILKDHQENQALFSLDRGHLMTGWTPDILRNDELKRDIHIGVRNSQRREFMVPAFAFLERSSRVSDFAADEELTRLLDAIVAGDEGMIADSLAAGADIDAETAFVTEDGVLQIRPIYAALISENYVMFKYLVERGADLRPPMVSSGPGAQYTELPLVWVFLENGDRSTVEYLLNRDVPLDVNVVISDENGSAAAPPLFWALKSGDLDLCSLLIDHGADINAVMTATINGQEVVMPALHFAYSEGGLQVLELVLRCGADATQTDHQGRTVLDLATERNDQKAVELITGSIR